MASGRERHQVRVQAVAALGRVLTRRARSQCELCEGSGDLRPAEVPPIDEEPDPDAAALLCGRCRELVQGGRLPRQLADLRFLEGTVWAEVAPVQIAAVRLLRRVAAEGVDWAIELNEGLWLADEIAERVDAGG